MAPADRERFDAHLAGCHGCRNYMAQMRHTIRVAGELSEETIEPAARARLLDAFRNWKTASPPTP